MNTVLWTGLADLKNWTFNWEIGKGTNGDNNPNMFKDMDLQAGDVIRVYVTPVDGWWMVKFYDGHWAEHTEAGVAAGIGETCEISGNNYNLDEHGGCIEFKATDKMVEQLTTLTDWGMCWVMMGQAVITKISVTHYNSLETTVWTGEAVADDWGNQRLAHPHLHHSYRCFLELPAGRWPLESQHSVPRLRLQQRQLGSGRTRRCT